MLCCEFKAHVNCPFLLVMLFFLGVIIDKQVHDALCLGSTTGAGIFMQKGQAMLVLLLICRNSLLTALGDKMEIPKQFIRRHSNIFLSNIVQHDPIFRQ